VGARRDEEMVVWLLSSAYLLPGVGGGVTRGRARRVLYTRTPTAKPREINFTLQFQINP